MAAIEHQLRSIVEQREKHSVNPLEGKPTPDNMLRYAFMQHIWFRVEIQQGMRAFKETRKINTMGIYQKI